MMKAAGLRPQPFRFGFGCDRHRFSRNHPTILFLAIIGDAIDRARKIVRDQQ